MAERNLIFLPLNWKTICSGLSQSRPLAISRQTLYIHAHEKNYEPSTSIVHRD